MKSSRTQDAQRLFADILAPPVLLLGPIVSFLRHHGYPLLRAEIFIIFASTVLLGVAVGWIIRRASPELRLVLVVVLILLVVDLSVDLDEYGPYIFVLAAASVLVWLLRQHVTSILLASGAAFLLSALVVSTPSANRTSYSIHPDVEPDRNLPPVYHFVLDEHIGVEGLPSRGLREDLVSAYAERGFRVFPHSYSHYSLTHNSLPNLLNFTTSNLDSQFINASGRISVLSENRYFAALSSRGYRIHVYQPRFLDLCQTEGIVVASCFTFAANTVGDVAPLEMPAVAKARLVSLYFLSNQLLLFDISGYYRLLHRMLGLGGISLPVWDWVGDHVVPPMSVVTDPMLADIGEDPRGEFVFAHFLLPHSPYMYDANCVPKRRARDRLDSWSLNAPASQINTKASRDRRYQLYEEQVRCVLREFEHLLATLETQPGFEEAIIIVQGDHGSRITINPVSQDYFDQLTSQDLRDAYSTLFAIKAPRVPVRVDSTMISVQALLRQLAMTDFEMRGPVTAPPPFVFIPGDTMRRTPYDPRSRRPVQRSDE